MGYVSERGIRQSLNGRAVGLSKNNKGEYTAFSLLDSRIRSIATPCLETAHIRGLRLQTTGAR